MTPTPTPVSALRRLAPVSALRRLDWPERLGGYVAAHRETPFAWGVFDCALFACGAIQVMTGVDPAAPMRGRYKTARGALRVLKRFAGGSLRETADKIAGEIGYPLVPLALARRGDVALIDDTDGGIPPAGIVVALALIMPPHLIVPARPKGLLSLPLSLGACQAWSIGWGER